MRQISFISYEQYIKELSDPDILDQLELQRTNDADGCWGHYIDPDTLDKSQKSQLRLKKFWSEKNLTFKNFVVQNNTPEWHLQTEPVNPVEEYDTIIYRRIMLCITAFVVFVFMF
jgi:hypothetical protein